MTRVPHRYFIINKPYNMVSQFVSTHDVGLLGDLDFDFPEGTHAVGRLDNHSEGLLILTTNKKVTRLLFSGEVPHERTYLVQVNNLLSDESLRQLQTGVAIKIKTGEIYRTNSCNAAIVKNPEKLFEIGERLTAFAPVGVPSIKFKILYYPNAPALSPVPIVSKPRSILGVHQDLLLQYA